jgi:alanyl-tRNA synthetase
MRCVQRGIDVDTDGFKAAMERQKRRGAGKHWSGSGEAATETVWFELKDRRRHRLPRLRHRDRGRRRSRRLCVTARKQWS